MWVKIDGLHPIDEPFGLEADIAHPILALPKSLLDINASLRRKPARALPLGGKASGVRAANLIVECAVIGAIEAIADELRIAAQLARRMVSDDDGGVRTCHGANHLRTLPVVGSG